MDPRFNRHTGEPHEHKKEIERRRRQEAALRAKADVGAGEQ